MRHLKFLPLLFLLLLSSCSGPEAQLVGTWEYTSYEIDKSGLGTFSSFLPDDWKTTADEYISKATGISNSQLVFKDDGTYVESFSGLAEDFSKTNGNYKVSPDSKVLTLKHGATEDIYNLKTLSDSVFVFQKEFSEYKVPVTLNIKYRKTGPVVGN